MKPDYTTSCLSMHVIIAPELYLNPPLDSWED